MSKSDTKICKLFGKLYMWRTVDGRLVLCPLKDKP